MKSDKICDCELCLLLLKSMDEEWGGIRFDNEVLKITKIDCKRLAIPECCVGCDHWFVEPGIMFGICQEFSTGKIKEAATSGGDGKDCVCYKATSQVKYLQNLKSC